MRATRHETANSANGAGPKAQSERTRQLSRAPFARGPSACVTRPIGKKSLTEPRAPHARVDDEANAARLSDRNRTYLL
jgi:hypothetical protein